VALRVPARIFEGKLYLNNPADLERMVESWNSPAGALGEDEDEGDSGGKKHKSERDVGGGGGSSIASSFLLSLLPFLSLS
jgi:hypothetical protein